MQKRFCFILCAAFLVCIMHGSPKRLTYISPSPGSSFVSPKTNIIVRSEKQFETTFRREHGIFEVDGSLSGSHAGAITLANDKHTLLFTPDQYFQKGETVSVRFHAANFEPLSFQFTISPTPQRKSRPALEFELNDVPNEFTSPLSNREVPEFPLITVTVSDNPTPGNLFLANFPFDATPNTPYLLILDNAGQAVFAREMPARCLDFKRQPNGLFTYFDDRVDIFYAMNSSYSIVDSFRCGNGYETDLHDLQILANGHALLMSYDEQIVRMDTIVPGGNPNARVFGLILQELDEAKNVVFQWRSWDHFAITDAIGISLTGPIVDYCHGNAIHLDNDGNLLLSSRHFNEITKISRTTGEMIWRWGGNNNQFAFVNDSLQFSYQHDIRRLPNGNVTLFDNGNGRIPQFSRALEYSLDEQTKTATLVWSYGARGGPYGAAMGNVQRLQNGNTIIGWGATNPTVTEVRPDGSKAFELTFASRIFSYRAFRFESGSSGVTHDEVPLAYRLEQNFPNPFNPATTIRYALPSSAHVTLDVIDMLGRAIETLVDENMAQGLHSVQWNGSNVSSGVYFYRMRTNGFAATRRLLLVR